MITCAKWFRIPILLFCGSFLSLKRNDTPQENLSIFLFVCLCVSWGEVEGRLIVNNYLYKFKFLLISLWYLLFLWVHAGVEIICLKFDQM